MSELKLRDQMNGVMLSLLSFLSISYTVYIISGSLHTFISLVQISPKEQIPRLSQWLPLARHTSMESSQEPYCF